MRRKLKIGCLRNNDSLSTAEMRMKKKKKKMKKRIQIGPNLVEDPYFSIDSGSGDAVAVVVEEYSLVL